MKKLVIFAFCLNVLLALFLLLVAAVNFKLGRDYDVALSVTLAIVNIVGAILTFKISGE